VLRILIFALAAVGLFAIVRAMFASARGPRDAKCADCIHCRKLYGDGVLCGFGAKEVFKNPAHIEMCPDHETRGL
jgi:hypothetical protein